MATFLRGRRAFLQMCGASGGAVLLTSLCGRLASNAYGKTSADGCFLLFGASNSMPHQITDGAGTAWAWHYPDHPLDDLRSEISVVEDVYNPMNRGIHGNYQSFLNVRDAGHKRVAGGITIDRQIAGDLAGGGSSRSINLGYPSGPGSFPISNGSADAARARYPVLSSPSAALDQLFGSEASIEERLERLHRRQSVLDMIANDVQRVSARLAEPERTMMDQYLTSVRELELEAQSASELDAACSQLEWTDEESIAGQHVREDVMLVLARIATLGLSCGVARVATVFGPGVGYDPGQPIYSFAPINSTHSQHDGITHNLNVPERYAIVERVHLWRAQLVRTMWEELQQSPLGDGSLADQSLMMWLNTQGRCPEPTNATNNHGRTNHIPVVLVGTAGGRIVPGQKVSFAPGERCVSDVFLTAAQAFGSPITSFGSQAHSRGPVTELVA